MIAFRDNLPVIVLPNGHIVAFEREWLGRALGVAANRAGYSKWWLADHVAGSVQMWLESISENTTTVTVAQLTRAVRGALQVIGYAEIGDCFEAVAPFSRISLSDLAQQAGDGFELAFFVALSSRLREVLAQGGSYCEIHGLDVCVRYLCRTRGWGRACAKLRDEIVEFARCSTVACETSQVTGRNREIFLYVA
jgi:hypothetical protein